MSTFPGTLKEQIPHAFSNLYIVRHKRRDRYKTDNERCSLLFLQTQVLPWPTYGPIMLHIEQIYLPQKHYKKYGLRCLEQLLNIVFSREPERVKVTIRCTQFKGAEFANRHGESLIKLTMKGSSEQLSKTRDILWCTVHQICYASNKPKMCRISYWNRKHNKTYGL